MQRECHHMFSYPYQLPECPPDNLCTLCGNITYREWIEGSWKPEKKDWARIYAVMDKKGKG